MGTVNINGVNVNPSGPIQPIENGFIGDTPAPTVSTAVVGPQGPPGPTGPAGPPGPAGGGTFDYEQMSAATVWTVNHDLGRYPAVTVTDYSGNVVYGDVEYINTNTVTITFSAAEGGYVHCS